MEVPRQVEVFHVVSQVGSDLAADATRCSSLIRVAGGGREGVDLHGVWRVTVTYSRGLGTEGEGPCCGLLLRRLVRLVSGDYGFRYHCRYCRSQCRWWQGYGDGVAANVSTARPPGNAWIMEVRMMRSNAAAPIAGSPLSPLGVRQ